jgi:GMP synthase-like glutamine amidotransferase
MKIGILKTDAVREEWADLRRVPRHVHCAAGPGTRSWSSAVYDVRMGEYPDIDDCDAYLITGSRHGVYEDLPWIPPLLEFIRELHKRRKKLVGICFGHQAVAQALGGRTEKAAVAGAWVCTAIASVTPQWFDGGDPSSGSW